MATAMPVISRMSATPGGSVQPNGSRLSCGASAGGRKQPAVRYQLAGAQTYVSSESRPRQLQALVRLPRVRVAYTRPEALAQVDHGRFRPHRLDEESQPRRRVSHGPGVRHAPATIAEGSG